MTRLYDVITFDCYGTLVDWNAGLGDALVEAVRASRGRAGREALLVAYHQLEPVVEAEEPRRYRDVLIETARRAARQCGIELPIEAARLVPESLPDWPVFPDTNPALEQLHAAGYRLGILSNVDDDLIAGTRRRLSVPFELVITAEQVGSYKPAPGHFEAARWAIGSARWLHAAQSYFHDVVPAQRLGIPVAWINRLHETEPGNARPDREFANLSELVNWLTAA